MLHNEEFNAGIYHPRQPVGSWSTVTRRTMKPLILLLATLAAFPHVSPGAAILLKGHSAQRAATALVIFGSDTVRAEVANTPALRSEGLMYRDAVPDGTGMLFVFDTEAERSFWMQNTYVALDVAFIDADFRIVDIQQMDPETTDIHDGARPAMFALEVRQGWFAEKGIAVGDRCQLIFSR